MSIEEASRLELIDELLSRPDFRGMIIWQRSEWKQGDDPEKKTDFRYESRNTNGLALMKELTKAIEAVK